MVRAGAAAAMPFPRLLPVIAVKVVISALLGVLLGVLLGKLAHLGRIDSPREGGGGRRVIWRQKRVIWRQKRVIGGRKGRLQCRRGLKAVCSLHRAPCPPMRQLPSGLGSRVYRV